eukprot:365368-Chlamydomonas_euryale.AAC.2
MHTPNTPTPSPGALWVCTRSTGWETVRCYPFPHPTPRCVRCYPFRTPHRDLWLIPHAPLIQHWRRGAPGWEQCIVTDHPTPPHLVHRRHGGVERRPVRHAVAPKRARRKFALLGKDDAAAGGKRRQQRRHEAVHVEQRHH